MTGWRDGPWPPPGEGNAPGWAHTTGDLEDRFPPRPRPRLIIVGCGKAKQPVPAPACELYTGSLFRACYRAAQALAAADPAAEIRILSALHGLIACDRITRPYDKIPGQPGAITAADLRAHARYAGWLDRPVTVLASQAYTALARQVWPDAEAPLEGNGGIGKMLHVCKIIYDSGPR